MNQLESHKNVIVICIYKLPYMAAVEFNDSYLQSLLDKFTNEKKKDVILMGISLWICYIIKLIVQAKSF